MKRKSVKCRIKERIVAMERSDWIRRLFQSVDDRNVEAFLAFLSEDVLFRFGNAQPVNGKTAVGNMLRGFFASIKALHHDLVETWDQRDTVVCHGIVTYTRKDSSTLSVPFANILRLDADLIREYLIYVDASKLYTSA